MRTETTSSDRHPTKSADSRKISVNFAAVLLAILSFPCPLQADEPAVRTGKAMEVTMSSRVSWSSVRAPLGEQLSDFQKQSEVAILRDRRINPQQPLYLEATSVPRVQILRLIAESIPDGAFCLTDNFASVGPSQATYRLPILLKHNSLQVNDLRKKIDSATFRKLTQKINASWTTLSEPRQILVDYAQAADVTITNPELVPHDLWGAATLPRMPISECATMLLNQFDLTFKVSGPDAELTLVPVDLNEVLEYRYEVGSSFKSKTAAAWEAESTALDIKWNGSNAVVVATLAKHIRLSALLTELKYAAPSGGGSSRSAGSLRTTRFQLKAERATIGQLIEYFRSNKINIDVEDESTDQTKSILSEIVQLNNVGDNMPGTEFFPLVFGLHFKQVKVLDDRVILSRE
jgi:hypothetical protein